MALTPDELEDARKYFEGSGLRREAERLARRRRATPPEVAMLAMIVGKLEACGVIISIQRPNHGVMLSSCMYIVERRIYVGTIEVTSLIRLIESYLFSPTILQLFITTEPLTSLRFHWY